MNIRKNTYRSLIFILLGWSVVSNAQNPNIKCYFNHPVNNTLSTGRNAVYLKGTFPDTIVSYINNAKYSLDFAIYDFTSVAGDSVSMIAKAVNNAHKRGVIVRWINNGNSSNVGMSLLSSTIHRVSSPTSKSYGIMHNKFLVIDINSPDSNDAYVITGSYNYSVEQTNEDYNNLLIVRNQQVATAYYNQFNQMWGGTDSIPNLKLSSFGTHKITSPVHYFNVNGTAIDVHFSPKDSCGGYVAKAINSANNDLTIGMYTFTDDSIAKAILAKYNDNVNVRCIEDVYSKTFTPYTILSEQLGKNFVVYNGGSNSIYHNKIILADASMPSSDPQVATGSFDWTASAENSNDENLILVHDSIIANQYYQSLCYDITVNGGNPCITPLPVDWTSFTASLASDKTGFISWLTTDEISTNHFEVERSQDGIAFERIGIVNDNHTYRYQFIDKNIKDGTNYYRIKDVDDDGGFTFSKVESIYNRTTSDVNVYPNPASKEINVLLPLNANSILIYNSVGTMLLEYDVHLKSSIKIDLSHWTKGSYYLEVISDNDKTVRSIEKL